MPKITKTEPGIKVFPAKKKMAAYARVSKAVSRKVCQFFGKEFKSSRILRCDFG